MNVAVNPSARKSPRSGPLARALVGLAGLLGTCLAGAGVAGAQAPAPTASSIVQEASRLEQQQEPQKAEAVLTGFLSEHPDDVEVLTSLAQLRVTEGRSDEATALLTRALRASPNAIAANQALGDLLLAAHHYPEAMDRYETVLSVSPQDARARAGERTAAVQLALESRRQGRDDAALASLEHAVEHLPDDPVLLADLGIEAYSLHALAHADEVLQRALQINAKDPTALYALARVELDEQHLPGAESHFRAYLAIRPEDASAHYGLGRLLHMEQQTSEAEAELQRSIALQPVQTEAYYELGQIELDAHQDAPAGPLFARVLDRDPKHAGALTGMGILAYRAKDYAAAERYLAPAVKEAPEYQPAHYYYGLVLGRQGKPVESAAELKRATELASHVHAAGPDRAGSGPAGPGPASPGPAGSGPAGSGPAATGPPGNAPLQP